MSHALCALHYSILTFRTTRVGVTTQTCEKSVQVDPLVLISCPDGFAEGADEECWKEEIAAPIKICLSNKKKDDGNCRPIERVTPKVIKCPPGSEREKEKCVQVRGCSSTQ